MLVSSLDLVLSTTARKFVIEAVEAIHSQLSPTKPFRIQAYMWVYRVLLQYTSMTATEATKARWGRFLELFNMELKRHCQFCFDSCVMQQYDEFARLFHVVYRVKAQHCFRYAF